MRNDDILLNEAYSQIYNEGIWDRLKGQAAGIGSGLKQGVQNVAGKIAGAAGADVKTSGKTMGGAYANAQQTSLLNSFVKKAQKELNDFINDMSKMGATSIEDVKKTHPQIAQQMQQVNYVIEYLKQSAAGQAPQGGNQAQAQHPAPKVDNQPQDQSSKVTPVFDDQSQSNQSQDANFNADVAGKPPAVQQSKQVVPHGVQRSNVPGGTMNVSSSVAKPEPKQVNQLPKEEPVEKVPSVSGAIKDQGVQDAEIVGGEEAQKESPTQGYANLMGQKDGLAPADSKVEYNGVEWKKTGTKWNAVIPGKGARTASNKDAAEIEKAWKQQEKNKPKTAADLTAGGMNPNIKSR